MVKMRKELVKESKEACNAVAQRIEDLEKEVTPLQIKMMIEEELGYGLEKEEIVVLALTFKHIDDLYEKVNGVDTLDSNMLYR